MLKYCRINDFEFTRECAIFDLLDIGLYHGWIVDPQVINFLEAFGLRFKEYFFPRMGDIPGICLLA